MDAPIRTRRPCSVEGCSETILTAKTKPFCKRHRHRERRGGSTAPARNFSKGRKCSFEGCDKPMRSGGYCSTHYAQYRRTGKVWEVREATGSYVNDAGYVLVYEPDRPDAQISGWMMEHRKVMADFLGRPLRENENVHHRNGVRHDNRLENLELWVSSQPSGQRPDDLVKWAKSILKTYEAEVPKHRKLHRRALTAAA
ncbi:HNH endonuclease [Gordonia phage Kabocha]|nr:HNH endonuclease [Gordonia phage Kabocha]